MFMSNVDCSAYNKIIGLNIFKKLKHVGLKMPKSSN